MKRIDKYGTGREEEKCKFYYIDLRIQGRCKLTGKKCNSICEQFIEREKKVKNLKERLDERKKQTLVKKLERLVAKEASNLKEMLKGMRTEHTGALSADGQVVCANGNFVLKKMNEMLDLVKEEM